MTSVVDTSVKHFHSGMVGAPVLNGVVGSMVSVLDACLVTGFDLKAATSLVVAGGVATLSFSGGHSATVDSVVLVAGSSIAALNGEQKVTAIGAGFVKFATAAAPATATGAITFKMAPAGWLNPFTDTNLRVYKSADPAGTGMSFRVDDTGSQSCRIVGYELMTDINTGSGPFPTPAQMAGGGYICKSFMADATPVKWYLIADGRSIVLSVAGYSSSNPSAFGAQNRFIGDFIATRPGGDPNAFALGYSISGSISSNSGLYDGAGDNYAMPRAYTGLGVCVLHKAISYTGTLNTYSGNDPALGEFPSVVDGGLRLSKRFFAEAQNTPVRGDLPGIYCVPQNGVGVSYISGSVVPGTAALAGRNLLALSCGGFTATVPSTLVGASFVDITGPWR